MRRFYNNISYSTEENDCKRAWNEFPIIYRWMNSIQMIRIELLIMGEWLLSPPYCKSQWGDHLTCFFLCPERQRMKNILRLWRRGRSSIVSLSVLADPNDNHWVTGCWPTKIPYGNPRSTVNLLSSQNVMRYTRTKTTTTISVLNISFSSYCNGKTKKYNSRRWIRI